MTVGKEREGEMLNGKELIKEFFRNIEELVCGAVFGVAWFGFIGWWSVLLGVVCSLLWRAGGCRGMSKSFRRAGVPAVICGIICGFTGQTYITALFLYLWCFATLSMGYGIPDDTDDGSVIGRFFFDFASRKYGDRVVRDPIFGKYKVARMADIYTRTTVAVLFMTPFVFVLSKDHASLAASVVAWLIVVIGYPLATVEVD